MTPPGTKLIASNRKARHDFSILDVFEAGIVLQGSEVKSLREGHVQLADAYARRFDCNCKQCFWSYDECNDSQKPHCTSIS